MHEALKFSKRASKGAAMVLAVVAFVVLILVVALVIDGGIIYGKRAEVSKAVDAAAIAAISNLAEGQGTAGQLARDTFHANYRQTPQDASAPDVNIQFGVSPEGNTLVTVRGTAHVLPVFLGMFPEFHPFHVPALAQAKRVRVALSLVLDRSGSMGGNGGWAALPPAANTFVDFFDDVTDQMALITFASHARIDVPLRNQFQQPIHTAIPTNQADYIGYTFFVGGLQLGFQETESASTIPGDEIVKIIVFFTDGLANTFQGTFDCPPAGTVLNLSTNDIPTDNLVAAIDPVTGAELCQSDGAGGPLSCCPGLTGFPPIYGGPPLNTLGPNAALNLRNEAKDRARHEANRIRSAGTVIYTIGLGNNLDPAILGEIANDPDFQATYNPAQPTGEFAHAPTAADLEEVFRMIARKILIRLSL